MNELAKLNTFASCPRPITDLLNGKVLGNTKAEKKP